MIANTLPKSLADNPSLDRWLGFDQPGRASVRVGKVEIGQGIATALCQIAAEELDIGLDRIDLTAGDTDHAPDEATTTSSLSIEIGGTSLRLVCAEARALVLAEAANRLGCSVADLAIDDGRIVRAGLPTGLDYWSVPVSLARLATGSATPKAVADYRLVGTSVPRRDLPAKVFGSGFMQDFTLPGMRHGHIVHPPRIGGRIAGIDETAIRRAADGRLEIVRHGEMLALIADDLTVLRRAAFAADTAVRWEGLAPLTHAMQDAAWLLDQPSQSGTAGDTTPAPPGTRLSATYSRAYVSHGSIGPSCALAEFRDGHLTVWCHVQGVYGFKATLAGGLRLAPAQISVRHLHGSGCYGHNGADDAGFDAAAIALRLPGTPIRVQWRREDEFGLEPVGSAMHIALDGVLAADGTLQDLTTTLYSGPHINRGGDGNLLTARLQPNPVPPSPVVETSAPYPGSGTRNAVPYYEIAGKRYRHHMVLGTPVRTSALRGLGAMPNLFALESFIDECAEHTGQDPLAYRIAMLSDPRARDVLQTVADMASWSRRGPAGSGIGFGLAFGRYKNSSGYAAVVVELEAEAELRLRHIWCAADAGLAVNPSGVIAQLEGGIIQGASWTLKEQVTFDAAGIASRSWADYPILRFSDIPPIDCHIMHRPHDPSLGMGEASIGPTAAAIGNAAAHALGLRLRHMPFTRDRIVAALNA